MRWFYDRRALWLILGALAVLLGVLATLQYRWLGEVSRAERERLQTGLASAGARFAADFDRELTRAYLHFLSPFADRPGGRSASRMAPEELAAELAGQLARWREVAPYPDLVRDVLWLERAGDGWRPARLDPEAARFVELSGGTGEPALRRLLEGLEPPGEPGAPPRPLYLAPDVPAAVLPRFELRGRRSSRFPRPRLTGLVVIRFDLEYLRESFLPALGARYLAWGEDLEFHFAVLADDPAGPPAAIYRSDPDLPPDYFLAGDFRAELFRPLPPEASRDLWREIRSEAAGPGGGDRQPGAARAFERLSRWLRLPFDAGAGGPGAGAGGEGQTGSRWVLAVRHPEGSLEAAVDHARRRNLAIGSGVLLLLAATVAMLLVSMRRARELAARQVEFVAGITHELRTPLAAIRSLAQNLADGIVEKPGQARRYGTLIEKESGRLSAMVEQALELSGILSERTAYSFERVEVPGIVTQAADECRPLLGENGRIEEAVAADLPAIRADPAALRRAVRNLIANAIKYGGEDGWVGIEAFRTPAGEVAVRISDHGPGIPRHELPRLFEAFYRGRDAVAAQVSGSGLGLSLVKHVVDAHGGRVEVESENRRGSAFTILLPAAETANVETEDPAG